MKTPEISIIRKQPIQEPVNPRKSEKVNTLTDVEKGDPRKHLQCFGIRYTKKLILMRRLKVLTIHQVKVMVV